MGSIVLKPVIFGVGNRCCGWLDLESVGSWYSSMSVLRRYSCSMTVSTSAWPVLRDLLGLHVCCVFPVVDSVTWVPCPGAVSFVSSTLAVRVVRCVVSVAVDAL